MSQRRRPGRPRHPTPLPAMTIGDYLAAVAARGPRPGTCAEEGPPRPTYAELALDVERVACGLLALGVEKGDRIAIWAPDSTEWTLVQLAAARVGAVLVILDGEWSTADLDRILREAGARLLFAAGPERLTCLGAEAPPVERLIALDALPPATRDALTWPELLVGGHGLAPALLAEREAAIRPDDPVSIEFERLPGGGLATTTLTHRDYLAAAGE